MIGRCCVASQRRTVTATGAMVPQASCSRAAGRSVHCGFHFRNSPATMSARVARRKRGTSMMMGAGRLCPALSSVRATAGPLTGSSLPRALGGRRDFGQQDSLILAGGQIQHPSIAVALCEEKLAARHNHTSTPRKLKHSPACLPRWRSQ